MASPPFDLDQHTLFVTLAGSHAHGTARPDSDVDLRGVCAAPLSSRLSLFHAFEQHEQTLDDASWAKALWRDVRTRLVAHPTAQHGLTSKTESVVFELAKLMRLCAEANPNALEILFADPNDWVYETERWQRLHAERGLFLSRKVQQTYLGYGLSQLKRIQTHRAWLLHPPAGKPTRPDFGLPEQGTFSADDRARLSAVLEENPQGSSALPPAVLATLEAEKRYLAALKHWQSYETWKAQRNRARAELERRYGYDTKHAAHLVRLMRMGLEVLRERTLRVRRPDAEELRAIRDGALSYDELLALAGSLEQQMGLALVDCLLPPDVEYGRIDALFFELASS